MIEQIKCCECGTEFSNTLKTCPNCGCPVQDPDIPEVGAVSTPVSMPTKPAKSTSFMTMKKISAFLVAVIGLAVIYLGVKLPEGAADHNDIASITTVNFSVKGASFGADFYTYVYDGIDTIVDELNDINKATYAINRAVAMNIEATDSLNNNVMKACGTVIIAIGLGILAYGVNAIGKAFAEDKQSAVS